jgi:hypothetical protein
VLLYVLATGLKHTGITPLFYNASTKAITESNKLSLVRHILCASETQRASDHPHDGEGWVGGCVLQLVLTLLRLAKTAGGLPRLHLNFSDASGTRTQGDGQ